MNASSLANGLPDVIAEIQALRSQFEVFRFLRRTAELFGFKGFLVMRLPATTSLDLQKNSVITNWPAEFLTRFDRYSLLRDSPLLEELRQSTLPQAFDFVSLSRGRKGEAAQQAAELYEEYGFVRGLCVPVHDVGGARSAVIFAGDREPLVPNEIVGLTMISIHIFQKLTDVSVAPSRVEQILTDREIDCLTWTAAGKTSADIASILSLSEHTVNHYLNRAAKKLDTVNRTQAVAKALRRGLIR